VSFCLHLPLSRSPARSILRLYEEEDLTSADEFGPQALVPSPPLHGASPDAPPAPAAPSPAASSPASALSPPAAGAPTPTAPSPAKQAVPKSTAELLAEGSAIPYVAPPSEEAHPPKDATTAPAAPAPTAESSSPAPPTGANPPAVPALAAPTSPQAAPAVEAPASAPDHSAAPMPPLVVPVPVLAIPPVAGSHTSRPPSLSGGMAIPLVNPASSAAHAAVAAAAVETPPLPPVLRRFLGLPLVPGAPPSAEVVAASLTRPGRGSMRVGASSMQAFAAPAAVVMGVPTVPLSPCVALPIQYAHLLQVRRGAAAAGGSGGTTALRDSDILAGPGQPDEICVMIGLRDVFMMLMVSPSAELRGRAA